jgi:hypothetical protein
LLKLAAQTHNPEIIEGRPPLPSKEDETLGTGDLEGRAKATQTHDLDFAEARTPTPFSGKGLQVPMILKRGGKGNRA